jgi:hypothetical protein
MSAAVRGFLAVLVLPAGFFGADFATGSPLVVSSVDRAMRAGR